MSSVEWNYTTVLNLIFLGVAAVLVVRYCRRGGGLSMLPMMNAPAGEMERPAHAHRA
jgi:hypothetical protein